MGMALPKIWPDEPDLLRLRLAQLQADPSRAPWSTRLIELKSERRAIGVAGFHAPPGGEWLQEFAPGGAEFGYTVFPPWRRQGFALEASRALMAWAERTGGVRTFALSISSENEASVGLARKLGFSKGGSWKHASVESRMSTGSTSLADARAPSEGCALSSAEAADRQRHAT